MRNWKLVLPALAATTALIAGAGCGGGDGGGDGASNEEYADQVQQVLEPLGTELQQIGDVVSQSDSAQQLADSVQSAEEEIQSAIDDLDAIDPPSDVEEAHQALVSSLDDFNAALKKLSDAAQAGNTSDILSAATELPAAVGELQTNLEQVKSQLEDAGINVSG